MKSTVILILLGLWAPGALAQTDVRVSDDANLAPPFTRWRLAEGQGQRLAAADRPDAVLQVSGNGEDAASWRADIPLTPATLYRVRFEGRRLPGAPDGLAVSGLERVNRDFPMTEEWQSYEFAFRAPDATAGGYLRLGQWHVRGSVQFRQAELWPVQAVYRPFAGDLELGDDESIEAGVYRFNAHLGGSGANAHRPLHANRAGFNSDRWVFGPGDDVVYRLRVGGVKQKSAQLRVAINHYEGGRLRVEAGTDGLQWQAAGDFDGGNRAGAVDLPAGLFPAETVYVRLRHATNTGAFQVNTFDYQAPLVEPLADASGETRFLEVHRSSPQLEVSLRRLEMTPDHQFWQALLAVKPVTAQWDTVRLSVGSDSVSTRPSFTLPLRADASAGAAGSSSNPTPILAGISQAIGLPGPDRLTLRCETTDGQALWEGRVPVRAGFLDDRRPGYWLPNGPGMDVWWCEGGWKIGRERGAPPRVPGAAETLEASLAGGEYEPAQLVLRPRQAAQLLAADWRPDKAPSGADKSALEVRIDAVEYVRVQRPTDSTGLPGWYPDPLPPLKLPLDLPAGQNRPLWLTFHAASGTPAGTYTGALEIETTLGRWRVPVRVRVYDFSLPRETHLRSALGIDSSSIARYHRLSRPEDREAVYDKYLRNFAAHRISPYTFYDYAPIGLRFEGEGTNRQARLDFTRFDRAAARWLDEYQFSTFKLNVQGMGGGTYQSRSLGRLEGFEEGTPEFARLFQDYLGQVERHLRERGWLDKAFTYWFDEPEPKDYDFVVAGMKRLKAAAPGLRRMLTEQPEPALLGQVDIWCGLTPEWTRERVQARRAAGEQVWWYICCGPTAPYVTEFIDHPGTELRLWPWQSWQYGVTGILVWETTYWTSPLVYPTPRRQDPWTDPMSYVSGYDFPVGHIGYWGNGDGRFLYPPRAATSASDAAPCFDDPVNSLRWENLRDGMEDYEYLWLLQREIERVEKTATAPDTLRAARVLLAVPETVSRDLTHFTHDPRDILRHRDAVARMIETLRHIP